VLFCSRPLCSIAAGHIEAQAKPQILPRSAANAAHRRLIYQRRSAAVERCGACNTSISSLVFVRRVVRLRTSIRGRVGPHALGLLIKLIANLRIPDFSDQQIYPTL
jgi:hypothetical protein